MRALHIASFTGNIGDQVNHCGFYRTFYDIFASDIDKIEMRKFYASCTNRLQFDKDLANRINTYDCLILGGGAYFDARWEYSATGTTLDLSDEFMEIVHVPVLINAMGYSECPDYTTYSVCDKFRSFLDTALAKRNWMITVRNDGSLESIENRYGKAYSNQILKVPDNGFFFDFDNPNILDFGQVPIVGLCITNDLFSDSYNKGLTPEQFNPLISELIEKLIYKGYNIILFAHTPNDLNVIHIVLGGVSDQNKRRHVIVAPYNTSGNCAANQLGIYYNACSCIIGMRFHSLIIALDHRIPTVSLAGHNQMEALFNELGLNEYCIRADHTDIVNEVSAIVDTCINESMLLTDIYELIYDRINREREAYRSAVVSFLQNAGA